jgi:hypothetical protein
MTQVPQNKFKYTEIKYSGMPPKTCFKKNILLYCSLNLQLIKRLRILFLTRFPKLKIISIRSNRTTLVKIFILDSYNLLFQGVYFLMQHIGRWSQGIQQYFQTLMSTRITFRSCSNADSDSIS